MVNFSDLAMTVQQPRRASYRLWRNTALASMTGAPHDARAAHRRLRVQRGRRQRLRARRPDPAVHHRRARCPSTCATSATRSTPGTTTHNLTLYKAPSGALVFSAGHGAVDLRASTPSTTRAYPDNAADPRMQQAQVNLLADMGAQPTTLMTGLDRRRRSRPTRPARPSRSPRPRRARRRRNGDRRHRHRHGVRRRRAGSPGWRSPPTAAPPGTPPPAPRRGPTPSSRRASAAPPIRVRAIDDSANIGTSATRSVLGDLPVQHLRQRQAPPTPDTDDNVARRARPAVHADRRRLRRPACGSTRAPATPARTSGSLWSPNGQRLAQVTFANETATGWQTATFADAGRR